LSLQIVHCCVQFCKGGLAQIHPTAIGA
jgi:hypothetical protein